MTFRCRHSKLAGMESDGGAVSRLLCLSDSSFDRLLISAARFNQGQTSRKSGGGQMGVSGNSAGGRRRRQTTNETGASLSDWPGEADLNTTTLTQSGPISTSRLHPPDELGLVGVVQRHQQLRVLTNVAHKILQVHQQAVGVDGAEERLAPCLQVLVSCLQEEEEEEVEEEEEEAERKLRRRGRRSRGKKGGEGGE